MRVEEGDQWKENKTQDGRSQKSPSSPAEMDLIEAEARDLSVLDWVNVVDQGGFDPFDPPRRPSSLIIPRARFSSVAPPSSLTLIGRQRYVSARSHSFPAFVPLR